MSVYLRKTPVLLIGAGVRAQNYARALDLLDIPYEVVGRGTHSAQQFEEHMGKKVWRGGIERFISEWEGLKLREQAFTYDFQSAIVATDTDQLLPVTKLLVRYGITNILLEQPEDIHVEQYHELLSMKAKSSTSIFVARSHRFLPSILKLKQFLGDKNITSIHFDFTESGERIIQNKPLENAKRRWFINHSTAIIDLAFHLSGEPDKLYSTVHFSDLYWHPGGAIFTGSGITSNKIPFSYHANWLAAGSSSISIQTDEHRYILNPIDTLAIIRKGTSHPLPLPCDTRLNQNCQPGLFEMVKHFLSKDNAQLMTIEQHIARMQQVYLPMVEQQPLSLSS